MPNLNRKTIQVLHPAGTDKCYFQGPLSKIKDYVDELINLYGENLIVDGEMRRDFYGESSSWEVSLYEERLENDEEYKARVLEETTWEQQVLEMERLRYETLKKKFEK
jgi:hypothetical protein